VCGACFRAIKRAIRSVEARGFVSPRHPCSPHGRIRKAIPVTPHANSRSFHPPRLCVLCPPSPTIVAHQPSLVVRPDRTGRPCTRKEEPALITILLCRFLLVPCLLRPPTPLGGVGVAPPPLLNCLLLACPLRRLRRVCQLLPLLQLVPLVPLLALLALLALLVLARGKGPPALRRRKRTCAISVDTPHATSKSVSIAHRNVTPFSTSS
jgi:hypothetical protein